MINYGAINEKLSRHKCRVNFNIFYFPTVAAIVVSSTENNVRDSWSRATWQLSHLSRDILILLRDKCNLPSDKKNMTVVLGPPYSDTETSRALCERPGWSHANERLDDALLLKRAFSPQVLNIQSFVSDIDRFQARDHFTIGRHIGAHVNSERVSREL